MRVPGGAKGRAAVNVVNLKERSQPGSLKRKRLNSRRQPGRGGWARIRSMALPHLAQIFTRAVPPTAWEPARHLVLAGDGSALLLLRITHEAVGRIVRLIVVFGLLRLGCLCLTPIRAEYQYRVDLGSRGETRILHRRRPSPFVPSTTHSPHCPLGAAAARSPPPLQVKTTATAPRLQAPRLHCARDTPRVRSAGRMWSARAKH